MKPLGLRHNLQVPGTPNRTTAPKRECLEFEFRQKGTTRRYKLVERLGCGTMGSVWKAVDSKRPDSTPVALKLYRIPEQESPFDDTQRIHERWYSWQDEAGARLKFRHPNIVRIQRTGEGQIYGQFVDLSWGSRAFTMMDWIEGQTLESAILEICADPLAPFIRGFDTQAFAVEILRALDFLHRKNILFMDLKPSNIMVRPDHRPVLLDLGGRLCMTDEFPSFMSTPDYSAKEVRVLEDPSLTDDERTEVTRGFSFATDFYSLGEILYDIFEIKHHFDLPILFPDALVSFMNRCLQENQEDRPAHVEESMQLLRV